MKKINLNFYSNEVFSRTIISKMCQSCTSLQLYICPVINPVNSQTFTSSPAFMRIRHFRQIATLTAVNRIKQKHSEATISFLIISPFFNSLLQWIWKKIKQWYGVRKVLYLGMKTSLSQLQCISVNVIIRAEIIIYNFTFQCNVHLCKQIKREYNLFMFILLYILTCWNKTKEKYNMLTFMMISFIKGISH